MNEVRRSVAGSAMRFVTATPTARVVGRRWSRRGRPGRTRPRPGLQKTALDDHEQQSPDGRRDPAKEERLPCVSSDVLRARNGRGDGRFGSDGRREGRRAGVGRARSARAAFGPFATTRRKTTVWVMQDLLTRIAARRGLFIALQIAFVAVLARLLRLGHSAIPGRHLAPPEGTAISSISASRAPSWPALPLPDVRHRLCSGSWRTLGIQTT